MRTYGSVCLTAVLFGGSLSRGAPVLEYRFNETGNSVPSTGSDVTPLLFTIPTGASADLHGAPGSGVTGGLNLPGSNTDRAFDNTASMGMGNAGVGGMAAHAADDDAIDGFTSFTLSGWFKSQDDSLPGNARIFKNTTGHDVDRRGYHMIAGNAAGEIRLATDATEKTMPGVAAAPQTWMFIAVTYNGTAATGNFKMYEGFRNAAEAPGGNPAVFLVASKTLNEGPSEQNDDVLQVGNEDGQGFDYNRPFDGWLDNLRIDGSFSNNTGALSMAALEARRAGDVPEPASAAMILIVYCVLGGRRRRRTVHRHDGGNALAG